MASVDFSRYPKYKAVYCLVVGGRRSGAGAAVLLQATGASWFGSHEPGAIENALGSGQLQLCDILLFRKKHSFFARNLSFLTGDFFSHAGMVFATPATDPGFTKSYVIECNFAGVDISPLERFLERRGRYVMAVKRFERAWFDDDLKRAVRGHTLNYIKAEYSLRTLTDLFLRGEAHLHFNRRRDGATRAARIERALNREMKLPHAFICSGFVQFGFYEGVRRAIVSGAVDIPEHALGECYFAPARRSATLRADLLSVSPQDMADCTSLSWKYLVQSGIDAREVGSEEEVIDALGFDWRGANGRPVKPAEAGGLLAPDGGR